MCSKLIRPPHKHARLLEWLRTGQTITTLQARDWFDITNPAQMISELRGKGWIIEQEYVTGRVTKQVYSRYWMPDPRQIPPWRLED